MSDKPEECECCQFVTTELKPYDAHRNFPKQMDEKKWLCLLCASTLAGNAHEYPEQYAGEVVTLKTICFVGNTILAAIKAAPVEAEGKQP